MHRFNRLTWRQTSRSLPFIGPAMVLLLVLMLYPMISVIINSTVDNYIVVDDSNWVGLEHYRTILSGSVFPRAFFNTSVFTVFSVAFHLVVGFIFAQLLNYPINRRVQSLFRVILILPWIFTAAVVAVGWRLLLNPLGIVNYVLQSMGLLTSYFPWFGASETALGALIVVNIWRGYPFIMVSLLAGLQGIPKVLYEAAEIDGANVRQRLLHVTIPQLMPVILSIGLLDAIWTFRLFPLVWLTTGGGPGRSTETLSTYTYKIAFNRYEFAEAAAMAVIILVCTMLLSVLYIRRQRMIQ